MKRDIAGLLGYIILAILGVGAIVFAAMIMATVMHQ